MSGAGDLHFDRYDFDGRGEWLMRTGALDAPPVLFVPPLFEELNRCRAFLATMMRNLAGQGFGCWLADLPGTGESQRALETLSWPDWPAAVSAAAERVAGTSGKRPIVASLRGGALVDHAASARGRWRFAPAEGASLARDLVRSSLVAAAEGSGSASNLAGYPIGQSMLSDLKAATVAPVEPIRTVRLESDPSDADHKLAGSALWRRSEPGNAPAVAEALAADIATWARQCDAC